MYEDFGLSFDSFGYQVPLSFHHVISKFESERHQIDLKNSTLCLKQAHGDDARGCLSVELEHSEVRSK